MKKTITSILTILILSNCSQQEISKNNIEEKKSISTAGFSNIWDYKATGGIMIGNQKSVDLLNEYIEFHNERNYEKIREMDSDSIQISGPNGESINGSDEHIPFLKEWFNNANTTWKPIWGTSIKNVNDDNGSMVLSIFDNTTILPDTTIRTNELIQAYINNNGKIIAFWVNSRGLTAKEIADITAAEEAGKY
ncbi:MAG: hypothetical protein ISQ99_06945 [Flavobacteriales bacterium]|nr:hypothetical protein [Flavobacteriales bacterium]MBL6869792.1 hypothetical protein [Flavobacteriales bacterium]|tara:strand:- start:195 stop:773 length:579 start_codon:yes stop_codon:yes gene_type:complete